MSSSWVVVWLLFVEFVMLVIDDSSNVVSLVNDSSNVYVVCVVSFDSSNEFVWLVSDDSSNVFVCRLLVVWLDVYVMYVSMYEGRANYQYYALQGSG
jgi:hypothetical protein